MLIVLAHLADVLAHNRSEFSLIAPGPSALVSLCGAHQNSNPFLLHPHQGNGQLPLMCILQRQVSPVCLCLTMQSPTQYRQRACRVALFASGASVKSGSLFVKMEYPVIPCAAPDRSPVRPLRAFQVHQ